MSIACQFLAGSSSWLDLRINPLDSSDWTDRYLEDERDHERLEIAAISRIKYVSLPPIDGERETWPKARVLSVYLYSINCEEATMASGQHCYESFHL
ncbi:hypothetical protein NDU88_002800 [Pleurodeles waltl]|uniref:Uncharacterized protein n=1 Tax=Pleurodeles waltl TaxID=8319 RepID=A0AAV7T336_PLEWA|nr:hypothetical protein NDU88_002800 [Pleurodeles waltl]